MLCRLRPRTWRGWGFCVFGLATFFVLDVLALRGADLASRLLISLSGMVTGAIAAYAVALFTLLFFFFVLIEYLAAPLIRYFAGGPTLCERA